MSDRAAAEAFAAELRGLYEAAGRPTLATLIRRGRDHEPRVLLKDSTVSGWLNGRSIPVDPAAVRFLITHLESEAARRTEYAPRGSGWWLRLHKQAWEQTHAQRGRRRLKSIQLPTDVPVPSEAAQQNESILEHLQLLNRSGGLPRVSEIRDPISLGVHPAALLEQNIDGRVIPDRVPPYIARDVDEDLWRTVERGGFVLIVGDSTAGKTRTAYEVMRVLLPDHLLVVPAGRDAVAAVIEKVLALRQCVVWLDDVERFIGPGGLTVGAVTRMLADTTSHTVILGTLRSAEYDRFSARAEIARHGAERETWQVARDVLKQATVVEMDRRWNRPELERARKFTGDARIASALVQSTQFGLAEILAAGPELTKDWRAAWRTGAHPRGAALVAAAVDCRRAGLHEPMHIDILTELAEYYLSQHGGPLLRPEPVDDAIAWATTPTYGSSSLLLPTDRPDHYLAFDYLVDLRDLDKIPQATWEFLTQRMPGHAAVIGEAAFLHRQDQVAIAAFRQNAEHGGVSPQFTQDALSAISRLIRFDPEQARELLQEFADFIRYSSGRTSLFTTLAEELRNIDRYLTIQSQRYQERLNVRIKIAPEVLNVVVPFLVLLPLVEIAVQHGIQPKPGGGTVTVIAQDNGNEALISVADDGVGIDAERLFADLRDPHKPGAHVGLGKINQRMRSVFGDEYALMVETAPGMGMTVIVRVPKYFPRAGE